MMLYISTFVGHFLLVIAALIPILNPLGQAPIFMSMTSRYSAEERAILARKVGIYGFSLLLVSMFIGIYVLEFFGVSLAIVRVGGGLLVATAGWQLMSSDDTSHTVLAASDERLSEEQLRQRAFFPLTFPISVGPGSITVAITLGAGFKTSGIGVVLIPVASVFAVAAASFLLYWCYRNAERLLKLMGETGTVIFLRLSAFILLCLGIQIFWNGASELLAEFVLQNFPK
ncbi:MarC family protein [Deefgea rivuli]|uniref:MarC family protein n=1 Tax=Deefgea rivuli TaxID=400948 RepID=UPI0004838720|nr:MarC family protein [Deefgea rivuli]